MRRANLIALAVFVAALVAVFRIDTETTRDIQARVMSIFAPFTRAGAAAQNLVTGEGADTRDREELLRENERLTLENQRLRIYEQRAAELQDRLDKLNRYFKFSEQNDFKLIAARIIARRNSAWYRQATIDKGSDDGIQRGSPVIVPDGLVGRVARVAPGEADILFITDEQCQVAAQVEGTRERGVLQGVRVAAHRRPELRLLYLPKGIDIPRGRRVFSWDNSNNFPPNLLLGTIVDFQTGDNSGIAIVQPAVSDLDDLKYVFVMEQEAGEPTAAGAPPR